MKRIFLAAAFAGLASPGMAATLSESTDFANTLNLGNGAGSLITLDAGMNQINGFLDGTCATSAVVAAIQCSSTLAPLDNVDVVKFTVPTGFELFDASIFMEGRAPEGFQYSAGIYSTVFSLLTDDDYAMNAGGGFSNGEVLPEGDYLFRIAGETATQEARWGGAWVATGNVRAVPTDDDDDTAVIPLPAGAPLILGALGLLGLIRRRRR